MKERESQGDGGALDGGCCYQKEQETLLDEMKGLAQDRASGSRWRCRQDIDACLCMSRHIPGSQSQGRSIVLLRTELVVASPPGQGGALPWCVIGTCACE